MGFCGPRVNGINGSIEIMLGKQCPEMSAIYALYEMLGAWPAKGSIVRAKFVKVSQ